MPLHERLSKIKVAACPLKLAVAEEIEKIKVFYNCSLKLIFAYTFAGNAQKNTSVPRAQTIISPSENTNQ
jgi:hypothetical protein